MKVKKKVKPAQLQSAVNTE